MTYHAKKAYEAEPSFGIYTLFDAYINSGLIKSADSLLNSSEFKMIDLGRRESIMKAQKAYALGSYETCIDLLEESGLKVLKDKWLYLKALVKIQKDQKAFRFYKAEFAKDQETFARYYALTQSRDSMYPILDSLPVGSYIIRSLGDDAFDPFRKEPQFRRFLQKHYIPLPD
jgi:hypothetical protein